VMASTYERIIPVHAATWIAAIPATDTNWGRWDTQGWLAQNHSPHEIDEVITAILARIEVAPNPGDLRPLLCYACNFEMYNDRSTHPVIEAAIKRYNDWGGQNEHWHLRHDSDDYFLSNSIFRE
jgi:hypothetical protein